MCPAGYELLFQPEVVRIYISLLKESKTPAILEASAGAIQNLCAGSWTVSTSRSWGGMRGAPRPPCVAGGARFGSGEQRAELAETPGAG